jgi:LysB family phage lysis regulatory protein
MELVVKSIIAALFVAVLGLVIVVQRDALVAAKDRAERAEQVARDRDGTIKTLMDTATRNRLATAKLQASNDNIAATLTERENLIANLLQDNPQVRTWADASLPDTVARLREHPAVTGAGDFPPHLPSGDPLPTAGGGAQD